MEVNQGKRKGGSRTTSRLWTIVLPPLEEKGVTNAMGQLSSVDLILYLIQVVEALGVGGVLQLQVQGKAREWAAEDDADKQEP